MPRWCAIARRSRAISRVSPEPISTLESSASKRGNRPRPKRACRRRVGSWSGLPRRIRMSSTIRLTSGVPTPPRVRLRRGGRSPRTFSIAMARRSTCWKRRCAVSRRLPRRGNTSPWPTAGVPKPTRAWGGQPTRSGIATGPSHSARARTVPRPASRGPGRSPAWASTRRPLPRSRTCPVPNRQRPWTSIAQPGCMPSRWRPVSGTASRTGPGPTRWPALRPAPLELLTAAQAAGYFNAPDHLDAFHKDPSFDPIRSRADFREWAARLGPTSPPDSGPPSRRP